MAATADLGLLLFSQTNPVAIAQQPSILGLLLAFDSSAGSGASAQSLESGVATLEEGAPQQPQWALGFLLEFVPPFGVGVSLESVQLAAPALSPGFAAPTVESLLPPNRTAWERALERASGERWLVTDVDVIRRSKDPWTCPAHLLNFLAFERSVDIWDETWPEWKKRSVIASAIHDHQIKGTKAGLERYVEIAGGETKEVLVGPEGFFASEELSKDELDAHIARHPKVRIILEQGTSVWRDEDGFFAGAAFADIDSTGVDDGPALHGRRAFLVKDGVTTPLQLATLVTTAGLARGVEEERVIIPGVGLAFSFEGEFVAGESFADAWDVPPQYYSYGLDRSYLHSESVLELSTVEVGYRPRDVRYTRESEVGDGSLFAFEGDFAGQGFAGLNDGGKLLADVIHLYDPSIPAPQSAGGGFADVTRVGMDPHRAEILIDWKDVLPRGLAIVSDDSFAGEDPAAASDTTRRDFLLDAVTLSMRLSDKLEVSFQTTRGRTFGDGILLDGSVTLGGGLPNNL